MKTDLQVSRRSSQAHLNSRYWHSRMARLGCKVHFVPILLHGLSSSSGLIAHFTQSSVEFIHPPFITDSVLDPGEVVPGLQSLGCRCPDTPEMRAEQLHEGEGLSMPLLQKQPSPCCLLPGGPSRAEEREFASESPGHQQMQWREVFVRMRCLVELCSQANLQPPAALPGRQMPHLERSA